MSTTAGRPSPCRCSTGLPVSGQRPHWEPRRQGVYFPQAEVTIMTEDPEHVARELIDAGPSEVPGTLTAAWILRLIDEFSVTAAHVISHTQLFGDSEWFSRQGMRDNCRRGVT